MQVHVHRLKAGEGAAAADGGGRRARRLGKNERTATDGRTDHLLLGKFWCKQEKEGRGRTGKMRKGDGGP